MSRRAGLHLVVPRRLQQHRKPAHFQFRAGAHQQIGLAHFRDETGPRLDAMRILQRIGCLIDIHLVTAEFLDERGPFGDAGENIQCGTGLRG